VKNGEVAYDNYVWKCWELSKSPSGVAEEIGISKSLISRCPSILTLLEGYVNENI